MKKKEKEIIKDNDASFAASLLRFVVCAAFLASIIFLGINTYNIVKEPFEFNKAAKENKIEEHIKENLNEDSIIFFEDEFTEEKVDLMIKEAGAEKVNDYIMIEHIFIEVCLLLTVIKLWNVLSFLLKSNLINPFTDNSIKSITRVISFEAAIIIISACAYIIEDIIFTAWGTTVLETSETLYSFGSISTVIIFVILRYILKTGKEKIENKN